MHRKLAIIAATGLGLCLVFLIAAVSVGGSVLGSAFLDFVGTDQPLCAPGSEESSAVITRQMDWTGGDNAVLALAASVHYRAGSGDRLEVTGPAGLVSHVQIKDGEVAMDCRPRMMMRGEHKSLEVTLPGRVFRRFEMKGAGEVDMAGIDQPELVLSLKGAGDVRAEGKVDRLTVDVRGLGDLKLGDLVAREADVSIRGAGDIKIAAEEKLKVDIRGAGDVHLTREPKSLQRYAARGRSITPMAARCGAAVIMTMTTANPRLRRYRDNSR